mmetsp:Transcript_10723/g.28116  ORF Transcript_10723/g.28116 Transcript_10723/m.28116 type:complete len:100 (-) Transcript_10723:566-865(-)
MTNVVGVSIERITLAAFSLCFTSKYDEGSSNWYTSARWAATIAMANLCNSPPERSSTFLPQTPPKSNWSFKNSSFSRSIFLPISSPTWPFTARGMWSTY